MWRLTVALCSKVPSLRREVRDGETQSGYLEYWTTVQDRTELLFPGSPVTATLELADTRWVPSSISSSSWSCRRATPSLADQTWRGRGKTRSD